MSLFETNVPPASGYYVFFFLGSPHSQHIQVKVKSKWNLSSDLQYIVSLLYMTQFVTKTFTEYKKPVITHLYILHFELL